MNGKKLALLTAALMTILGAPTSWASPVTINFEDGANLGGTAIGNAYESLGVSFSNAIWITSASTGNDTNEFWYGNAGLGVENGVNSVNPWAFPGVTSPIVITFANPVAYVSIDALDVGDNGAGLYAHNAQNQLVGQDRQRRESASAWETISRCRYRRLALRVSHLINRFIPRATPMDSAGITSRSRPRAFRSHRHWSWASWRSWPWGATR